jgi:hypothetical protein
MEWLVLAANATIDSALANRRPQQDLPRPALRSEYPALPIPVAETGPEVLQHRPA